jgi:hypothetical protein
LVSMRATIAEMTRVAATRVTPMTVRLPRGCCLMNA